jgi:fucose permease
MIFILVLVIFIIASFYGCKFDVLNKEFAEYFKDINKKDS